MDVMIAAAIDELAELNTRLRKLIERADPASFDWRPVPETSSLAVLMVHMLGAEEGLVSTAVGVKVPRDRDTEFRAAGVDKAAMLARLTEVDGRVRDWLTTADAAMLAETRTARNRQQTGAFLVMHAAAHVGEHLGHAELTYQLWTQSQG